MTKPDRESEIRSRWAGMSIGEDPREVNFLLALIDRLRFMLEESKKTTQSIRDQAERFIQDAENCGLEYREDGDPWRFRNTRALNAECDADKLEKIADGLAAVIRMTSVNEQIMAGKLGNTPAWDGDFVRSERDAALSAWVAYQDGFKHRGEKDDAPPREGDGA